jgi:hypothetical protein
MKKLIFAILFATIFLNAQSSVSPKFTPITDKVAVIKLKTTDTVIYRTVNIAIGEVFVIEFPKNIVLDETPTIGDAGLLKIEVENDPLKIRVWGLMFPNTPESAMYGLNSNIQFKINSGQTFILNMVLQPAKDASNRIIISYPEWENSQMEVNKQLEKLRNKLNEEYEKKLKEIDKEAQKRTVQFLADSFSEFFQCTNYSARAQEDLVFVRSDRMCKIGRNGIIAVNFSIKNRYRQRFHVETVKIYSTKGGKVEIDNAQYHLDKYSMQFDEVVNGAAAFSIKDEDYSKEYIIEVTESAGKKRKIELKVTF